jgi:hypothetical protein
MILNDAWEKPRVCDPLRLGGDWRFVPKRSDYNILVALHKITPQDLRNAHASIREWHKMGHPVPVYFTVSELNNAADVFPIEFYRMEAARKSALWHGRVGECRVFGREPSTSSRIRASQQANTSEAAVYSGV